MESFLEWYAQLPGEKRLIAFSKLGKTHHATEGLYRRESEGRPVRNFLMFGAEDTVRGRRDRLMSLARTLTRGLVCAPYWQGLPDIAHAAATDIVRIPMAVDHVRSLNLATSVGVGVYEVRMVCRQPLLHVCSLLPGSFALSLFLSFDLSFFRFFIVGTSAVGRAQLRGGRLKASYSCQSQSTFPTRKAGQLLSELNDRVQPTRALDLIRAAIDAAQEFAQLLGCVDDCLELEHAILPRAGAVAWQDVRQGAGPWGLHAVVAVHVSDGVIVLGRFVLLLHRVGYRSHLAHGHSGIFIFVPWEDAVSIRTYVVRIVVVACYEHLAPARRDVLSLLGQLPRPPRALCGWAHLHAVDLLSGG